MPCQETQTDEQIKAYKDSVMLCHPTSPVLAAIVCPRLEIRWGRPNRALVAGDGAVEFVEVEAKGGGWFNHFV